MKRQLCVLLTVSGLAVNSFAALQVYLKPMGNQKTVTFLKEEGMSAEEFSRTDYRMKPDAAWLERNYPLSADSAQNITSADLEKMTQEELDQIYIRSKMGVIVPGTYAGKIAVQDGVLKDKIGGVFSNTKVMKIMDRLCSGRDVIECLGEVAWKGKRIYPKNEDGVFLLRNAISKELSRGLSFALSPFVSAISNVWTLGKVAEDFNGESKHMLFPAKVYYGMSLLDGRKESIIIDYAWGSDFSPFIKGIDDLAGRGFMDIRDEIRMVKPGLYLGRAYTNKIFLLNFILTYTEGREKDSHDNEGGFNR